MSRPAQHAWSRTNTASSRTRSRSPAIRTTTRSPGSSSARTRMPPAWARHRAGPLDATTYKYVRYGNATAAQAFDPQAFTRVDIMPAAATYPSGRTYAQRGDGQLRQVVRVLPDPDPGDEDRRRHRVLGVERRERARRFPHALGKRQRDGGFSQHQAVSTRRPQGRTGSPFLCGRAQLRHAAARRRLPHRRILLELRHSGLPGATDPLDATTGMCQPNYHLLSTDGYWNYSPLARAVSATRTRPCPAVLPGADPRLHAGQSVSRAPTTREPTATSNTLADLAMKYWISDIRPTPRTTTSRTRSPRGSTSRSTVCRSARRGTSFTLRGIDAITSGASELADTRRWPRR